MINFLVGIFLIVGSIFCLFTSLGLLRFPDFYSRLQALTKASTFGIGLIVVAVIIYFRNLSDSPLALLVLFIVFVTNPVGAGMLARASYLVGVPLYKGTIIDQLRGVYNKQTRKLEDQPTKKE